MFAFVVLGLVSSVVSQEIGWEERLQNDPFCVEWDVKPQLNQLSHPSAEISSVTLIHLLRTYYILASYFPFSATVAPVPVIS